MNIRFTDKWALVYVIAALWLSSSLWPIPELIASPWTPFTSEEHADDSPAQCTNSLVSGLKCQGKYCDDLSLQCGEPMVTTRGDWSPYFSEEDIDGYVCPAGEYVQGVKCKGRYCDGVSVQCALAPESNQDACYWSKAVSEEDGGTVEFGRGTYVKGLKCKGKYCDQLESYVCPSLENVCNTDECKARQAKRFAPILHFDQAQDLTNKCFPSDAGDYWQARQSGHKGRICNESPASILNGQTPTYYAYQDCSRDSTVIMYWFFYGYQDNCLPKIGNHHADWERVAVKIKDGRLDRVMFFQHGGSYTKFPHEIETKDGRRPLVYVGKNSHGSYHDQGGTGSCLYFEDFRHKADKNYSLNTEENLVELHDRPDAPEWMRTYDATNFDNIPSPTRRGINLCSLAGCSGEDLSIGSALCLGQCGCMKSSVGKAPF